jgi:transcriptional regulator with XRE-family HTH domain
MVARNLRRLRLLKQLSQEELAHRAGLYRTYVGLIEREKYAPTVDVIGSLAEALGIAPAAFFDETAGRGEPVKRGKKFAGPEKRTQPS